MILAGPARISKNLRLIPQLRALLFGKPRQKSAQGAGARERSRIQPFLPQPASWVEQSLGSSTAALRRGTLHSEAQRGGCATSGVNMTHLEGCGVACGGHPASLP